ncbi:glycosyltransferase [Algirhabdus cladophorae]|uniref:glycosyltransferase n=1 Tax=Algirhabdus cladophorae TaxID=3377108 RepID=UPI003B846717
MPHSRPRILFAWEMGENLGHANKLARVAEQLEGRADIIVAARNPAAIRTMGPQLDATLLPAPFVPSRVLARGEAQGESFAGVLASSGWDNPQNLTALMEAWRNLMTLLRPDIVVTQAAPTAQMVSKQMQLPTVILGSSYDNPPLTVPMPAFAPDQPRSVALALRQEADVLHTANTAIAALFGAPAAARFADLLRPDVSLLMTLPQLDCYANTRDEGAEYLGPLISDTVGATGARWANDDRAKVFAYLRPGSAEAAKTLGGLYRAALQHQVILVAPGLVEQDANRLTERGVQVFDSPLRLDKVLPDSDLGVSHAGHGISAGFLKYGLPQIAVPTHREQLLTTQAIARAKVGLGMVGSFDAAAIQALIDRTLTNSKISLKCREVSDFIKETGSAAAAQRAGQEILIFAAKIDLSH